MRARSMQLIFLASWTMCALLSDRGVQAGIIIPVPNGDFETLYKPGSTSITATMPLYDYTYGIGSGVSIAAGVATYSDGTTGTTVDTPGWKAFGGGGGAIQATVGVGGSQGFSSNGAGYGEPDGQTITSAASLGTIQPNLNYTLSAEIGDVNVGTPIANYVLQLNASSYDQTIALTPTSSVDPGTSNSYQLFSNTYSGASLLAYIGESLTITIGNQYPASGDQLNFDDIQLTADNPAAVPEPTSMILMGLGLTGSGFQRWRRGRGAAAA